MKANHYVTSSQTDERLAQHEDILFSEWHEVLPPFAEFGRHPGDLEADQLRVYPDVTYQRWTGFGGAFTEAAAVAWLKMSEKEQKS